MVNLAKPSTYYTALQENEKAKRMNATCGPKCLDQLEKFSQVGLWGRTFSALLIGTGDWYSTRCRLTWKLKGTKYSRLYFQLVPSTPPIDATGFGLLPTPAVMEDRKMPNQNESRTKKIQSNLNAYTITKMLQTPTTQDFKRRGPNSKQQGLSNVENWTSLLPTPTAQDGKNSTLPPSQQNRTSIVGMLCTPTAQSSRGNTSDKRGKGNLTDQIAKMELTTSKTSQLNPQFVMEMMGFPPDWTLSPFLNGEMNL